MKAPALKTATYISSLLEAGTLAHRVSHLVEINRPARFILSDEGTAMRAHGLETPPLKDKTTAALSWARMAQEVCL